jgi:acyl dehydratase
MTANTIWPERLELARGPVSALDLALFAAASGDHNLLHLDVTTAQAAGFDKPLVHGMLTMAYAAQVFSAHFGATSVRGLQTRFTGAAKLGDTVRLVATLKQIDPDDMGVYDLGAHTETGRELMSGQARIVRRAHRNQP